MEKEQTERSDDSSAFATPLAIVIGAIMVSGAILYSTGIGDRSSPAAIGSGTEAKIVDVDMEALADDDPVLGDDDAPVTIVEFSDFQCPFCRQFFTNTHQQIIEEYIDTGIAKLVYRDFPLEFHSAARVSAIAAECADEQGKFWEYHDHIFQEQAKQGSGTISYGVTELKQWAREIGLNTGQFNQCLDSEKYGDEVDKDFEDGQSVGVSGTPSFFINGRILIGAQPFSTFEQAIEAALSE